MFSKRKSDLTFSLTEVALGPIMVILWIYGNFMENSLTIYGKFMENLWTIMKNL